MSNADLDDREIRISEFADRDAEVPHAKAYHVRIDGEEVRVETAHPTGEELLHKVHKRP